MSVKIKTSDGWKEVTNAVENKYLPLIGGTMSGAINMGSQKITSLASPTNANDAATKTYVDTLANSMVFLVQVSGGSTSETITYTNEFVAIAHRGSNNHIYVANSWGGNFIINNGDNISYTHDKSAHTINIVNAGTSAVKIVCIVI